VSLGRLGQSSKAQARWDHPDPTEERLQQACSEDGPHEGKAENADKKDPKVFVGSGQADHEREKPDTGHEDGLADDHATNKANPVSVRDPRHIAGNRDRLWKNGLELQPGPLWFSDRLGLALDIRGVTVREFATASSMFPS
jgi:hypothetical protein